MPNISDSLVVNTMTGKMRFVSTSEPWDENEIQIGSVIAENGASIDLGMDSQTLHGVSVNISNNTIGVMGESREPVYSLDRVPPKCFVCGHKYAAPGPDDRFWFREYLHHRHKTWMPVCEECTSQQMTLRH